ncbi:hypothetical protein ACH61_02610 [Rathayibacter tanaceti]|uniref:Uncharacterized protein n=1 Tax=Rathayibacter tanaceti TaxID=1671680 RepID=A0A162J054_9MICO|nr:hypothetical protein ACH61_02610 [Rathayibacter tanaceti]
MRLRGDRADAGAASAVGDAERLVQVEVRDVATEVAEAGEAEQGVEVRAVDVNLAAGLVDEAADLGDLVFVDAVRGRVGDHQRGERLGVLADPGAQVVEVDVAQLVAGDDHDAHPREDSARRIGAVRAGGDQADGAVGVAAGPVPAADRQEPGELPLRAGVGLERDRVVAGEVGQPPLQLVDQRERALHVGLGRERVQVRELGPADRLHLSGGVELHRAGAERDHAAVQRVVGIGEALEEAHHRRLAVVAAEDGVHEEGSAPLERDGDAAGRAADEAERRVEVADGRRDGDHLEVGDGLVDRDGHRVGVDEPHVEPCVARAGDRRLRTTGDDEGHGVEEVGVTQGVAAVEQEARQKRGTSVHALGDRGESVGAVVDRVHRRHHGQQHLRGADVGGRLLAADVLLAGLQRQAVGRVARRVLAHADQAAGGAGARVPCAPRGSRRAVRRSPSARRSAARCRPRCPRRARPASGRG